MNQQLTLDTETGELNITPPDNVQYAKFARSAGFNYDTNAASDESGIDFTNDPGLTQQQFKDECDINEIVRRFGLTGELPENVRTPRSGDFTGVNDYQSAMNAVRAADEAFMELPGELRKRFDNDPQKLMDFMEDENNKEEAIKLGLVNKPKEVIASTPPIPGTE